MRQPEWYAQYPAADSRFVPSRAVTKELASVKRTRVEGLRWAAAMRGGALKQSTRQECPAPSWVGGGGGW